MNLQEMSSNARLAGDDTEANSADCGKIEEDEGLKTKRPEWIEGKKTVICFSDTDTDTAWLKPIPKHESLEVLVASLFCAEDFIKERAHYSFSAIIFCHSVKSKNCLSHLESCLRICCETFGQEKVYMVITDLEDTKSARKVEEEWSTRNDACCQLLTLTQAELDGIKGPLMGKRLDKMDALRQILLNARDISSEVIPNKLQIGIFSRSHEEDYSWLRSLLRSEHFSDLVKDIKPYYISNNGSRQFRNDVQQCTFTILYHTATRGRINVTDMENSSLYDEELKGLHECLGQERVIVVIDDLGDSSDQMKSRIEKEQPSIFRLAKDLFLFSKEEKASEYVRYLPTFQKKMRKLHAMMSNEDLELYDSRKEKGGDTEINLGQNVQNQSRDGNSAAKPAGRIHKTYGEQSAHSSQRTSEGKKTPTKEQRSVDDRTGEVSNTKLEKNAAPDQVQGEQSAHSSQFTSEGKKTLTKKQRSEDGRTVEVSNTKLEKNAAPDHVQGPVPNLLSQLRRKQVVGFFSSSSEEDYRWLMDLADRHVKRVHSSCIGNSGFHHFMHAVQQCTFGILYHTMKRGRINISDVTDAIYDQHLGYMSSQLGRTNVIVVIDDVVDSSDQEKTRILKTQPSIGRLAKALILINKQEKTVCRDIDDMKACRLS